MPGPTLELPTEQALDASAQQLLPASLSEIFRNAALGEDLAAIERLLMGRIASQSRLLTAAGAHTIAAGGKRLRAALVLLAARLKHYDLERAARPAAA